MNVLQVTTHINIGGIANYIVSLSKALRAQGIGCTVASSGGDMETELKKSAIAHRKLDIDTKFEFGPKALKSVFAINRIVREEKIDIIHAHSRVSQVAASLSSNATGVPFVTTCHGYFQKRSRKVFDTWGEKVIAISDAVRAHLLEDFEIEEARIALIYTGVDTEKFGKTSAPQEAAGVKKAAGLREDAMVIGTIGRLSSVKGQKYLIQALAELQKKKRAVQGLIVGNGEEEAPLKALAKSLGLSQDIAIVSADTDTAKYLAAMDVFVLPSEKEGLGLALLEALAAGRPCIASDIGGIGNIIDDRRNGILVPVGNAEAIARAAMMLLDDKEMAMALALNGKKTVEERFSLGVMAGKIIEVYNEVRHKNRG